MNQMKWAARILGSIRASAIALLVCAVVAAGCIQTGTKPPEKREELVFQVRSAETAFAESMAARDLDVFETFVADEALFFGGRGVLRGKKAVVEGWSSFFKEETAPFSWEPELVDVLDSGTLALSSGPVRDPEGRRIGTFNSIWRREADGPWRVVFDKGCPPCD